MTHKILTMLAVAALVVSGSDAHAAGKKKSKKKKKDAEAAETVAQDAAADAKAADAKVEGAAAGPGSSSSSGDSGDLTAVTLKRPDDKAAQITDLTFSGKGPEVTTGQARGGMDLLVYAKVEGRYTKGNSTLLYRNRKVTLSDEGDTKGKFTLNVPIYAAKTKMQLVSVAATGDIQKEDIILEFPKYLDYLKSMKSDAYKKRFVVAPSLGLSTISYSQTGVQSYSSISMTAKAAVQFWILPPKFDVALNAYFTLFPITRNLSQEARFLGVNLRFGYLLPFLKEPWRLSILGGAYYTRMFVTGNAFGFTNMAGPQIFPTLRRTLDNGDSVYGYFKFSPVTDGLNVLSLRNREIAFGGGWNHELANGWPIAVMADFANFTLLINNVAIESTSFTLSVGTGF